MDSSKKDSAKNGSVRKKVTEPSQPASRQASMKTIRTSPWSRSFALAKVSAFAGAKAASHAARNFFGSEIGKADRLKELLTSQMHLLSQELGQLKGSLMKVGQLLSMYGEHFLPPEANQFLKSLQNQSPPLEWEAMEKVVRRQLSAEILAELEIDPEPIASASLGQVYRARRKQDGRWLAMKVQYPGVDRAIESDLKALRSLLMMSKLIPSGPKYDQLFEEVRKMLHQEVDYQKEMQMTMHFRELLKDDPRFIVPEVFSRYSGTRILTTSLEEGVAVDSAEVSQLSQARRNAIGGAALDLYFQELFRFGAVQTDPHFGNYRVRIGASQERVSGQSLEDVPQELIDGLRQGEVTSSVNSGNVQDQLILLDFGAVRKLSKKFLSAYLKMVRGGFERDFDQVISAAAELGFLRDTDSPEQRQAFYNLCILITEPFLSSIEGSEIPAALVSAEGHYIWAKSDLPKRVAKEAPELAVLFKLRSPPPEIVFLDRKLGGMFILMSQLRVQMDVRKVVQPYIDNS